MGVGQRSNGASERTPDLHLVLREELAARDWGVGQLAARLELRYGVVSRWIAEDPRKRVVPLPAMCVCLAIVFGLDPIDVFRHAGYLPAVDTEPATPHTEQIATLGRRLRRILTSVPDTEWRFAEACAEVVLDQLQALLLRLELHEPS